MRKIFLFINTVCLLSFVACSSAESESKDKKDSSEEIDDSDSVGTSVSDETNLSDKQKALTSMIGKHKLNSISGLVGANAMFDIYLNNGVWTGEGSANEGGVREGYDLELSDVELNKLNTMCIVVSKDLTVTLESNGKTFCKIPFMEELKELKLDPAKEYKKFGAIPEELSEKNSFFDTWHYLLVRDDFSESVMQEIDIPQSFTPDFICIKFSENLKEFQVEMRQGDCCDNETYTFKK